MKFYEECLYGVDCLTLQDKVQTCLIYILNSGFFICVKANTKKKIQKVLHEYYEHEDSMQNASCAFHKDEYKRGEQ